MNDYRLYVLMRNDLASMTPGRCMAQANHAASVVEHDFGSSSKCPRNELRLWKGQTKQGFGTCIVLSASKDQIDAIFNTGELKQWIMKGWVIDPDYVIRVTHEVAQFMHYSKCFPFKWVDGSEDDKTIAFTRSEKTCAFIMGTKEDLEPYLGNLPLY